MLKNVMEPGFKLNCMEIHLKEFLLEKLSVRYGSVEGIAEMVNQLVPNIPMGLADGELLVASNGKQETENPLIALSLKDCYTIMKYHWEPPFFSCFSNDECEYMFCNWTSDDLKKMSEWNDLSEDEQEKYRRVSFTCAKKEYARRVRPDEFFSMEQLLKLKEDIEAVQGLLDKGECLEHPIVTKYEKEDLFCGARRSGGVLSEERKKSLGLYVNHKVSIQLSNSTDLFTGDLLGYTENEIIFSVGDSKEKRIPFDKLEDIFYRGYITSYQREDKTGRIDDTYMFRLEDCVGYKAGQELLRQSEFEYAVCCHLIAVQDKFCTGSVRIGAKDVNIMQEPNHVLPMSLLTEEVLLYKLRRQEAQIGILEQDETKYAVCYEGRKNGYFDKGAIEDILKCPKINDYVTVFFDGKEISGVVASVEMNRFCVFTGEENVQISYEEGKWIRYWGKVIEKALKSGEKLFLIDGIYPVTENSRKGYGQGRGKTGLKHGMTVSYILGINKNGYYVREYSAEEEKKQSTMVGVITSFDSSGKGYIGTFYERGAELREEDAKAFFLEEDLEKQILPDLLRYVYVVKYNTVQQGGEQVTSLEISEIYDRSSVDSIRINENGEVCVIPREREELCYYLNHEIFVVRKGQGDIVEGRCIHIDETGKKMVLLCGDGKESMYRAIAFEEIATVRGMDRMLNYEGQRDIVLEEKNVVFLDYCENKGFLVMNRDEYESDDSAKKVWYYLTFGAQAESELLKKEYYRYDYPVTMRVVFRNGELQKVVEIGEGVDKQNRSEFFPIDGRLYRYGFIVTYKRQTGIATICDAFYLKGSKEEAEQERKKVELQDTGWDELLNNTNRHIYFVTYEEAYDEEKEEYVFKRLLSVEMYPKKQIYSAKVIDGRPEFVFLSDIEVKEEGRDTPEEETEKVVEAEAINELPTESKTATDLSIGETIFLGDTAYEYLGKTEDERLKVRTIPFAGEKGFEQAMTRNRLTMYRFGVLTGMDKGQGIVYMDDYLRVPVTRLDERAVFDFGNGKKKVVVSYLWDADGRVKEVSIPKKNMLGALPWKKGIVSAVLSENASTCTVLIRLEEEGVIAEYQFSTDTKQNVRRRKLDFVGEPVYVRAVKATCGQNKDLDIKWYALELHFVNENGTVIQELKGKPQGEPDKIYIIRVENVNYQTDMEYADYWAEKVEEKVVVRLEPHYSEERDTELLRAVPVSLPMRE